MNGPSKAASTASVHGVVSKLSRRFARQPRAGSLPWVRAWYGDDYRRGAPCRVDGERARIVSASNGRVAVVVWSTGKRQLVLPGEITFDAAELALV